MNALNELPVWAVLTGGYVAGALTMLVFVVGALVVAAVRYEEEKRELVEDR